MSGVRWGVIGCGWVARDYGAAGLRTAGEVVAACDRSADAARAVCPEGFVTGDPAELAARPEVEAVYVATPNHVHAEGVLACAAAGKAVLCEKPIAHTTEDARRIVAACHEAGVVYATAFDQRWHPAHVAMRRLIGEGAVGTVTQCRIHYACWLPPDWSPDGSDHDNWRADPGRAGGGAAIDLAPHGLDLLATLLGRDWGDLHALTQRAVHDYPVDDGAVLVGPLGPALASLHVAYNCPDAVPRRRLEVVGTGGSLVATNTMGQTPGGALEHFTAGGERRVVGFDAGASPFAEQAKWFASLVRGEDVERFEPAADLRRHELLLAALERADAVTASRIAAGHDEAGPRTDDLSRDRGAGTAPAREQTTRSAH